MKNHNEFNFLTLTSQDNFCKPFRHDTLNQRRQSARA